MNYIENLQLLVIISSVHNSVSIVHLSPLACCCLFFWVSSSGQQHLCFSQPTAEEIQELWREYEDNASLEANLVKDFDKVEMILQALEYETEYDKEL